MIILLPLLILILLLRTSTTTSTTTYFYYYFRLCGATSGELGEVGHLVHIDGGLVDQPGEVHVGRHVLRQVLAHDLAH